MKHVKIFEDFLNEGRGNKAPDSVAAIAKKFQLGSRVINRQLEDTYLFDGFEIKGLVPSLNGELAKKRVPLSFGNVEIYVDQSGRIRAELNPYILITIEFFGAFVDVDGEMKKRYNARISVVGSLDWTAYKTSADFGGESYTDVAKTIADALSANSGVIAELLNVKDEESIPASVKGLMDRYTLKLAKQFYDADTVAEAIVIAAGSSYSYKDHTGRYAGTNTSSRSQKEAYLKEVISALEGFLRNKEYLKAPNWSLDGLNEAEFPASVKKLMDSRSAKSLAKTISGEYERNVANAVALAAGSTTDYTRRNWSSKEAFIKDVLSVLNRYAKDNAYLDAPDIEL